MDDNSTSIESLQSIIDMDDDVPDRWHSIRLPRLKAICKLAMISLYDQKQKALALDHLRSSYSKKKGIDFPCALFPGPMGDCNKTNCKC
jgi:hypothetical protein